MTNLTYVLADGTEVKTYAQALASGQHYTAKYTPVEKPPVRLTPKQETRRVKVVVK